MPKSPRKNPRRDAPKKGRSNRRWTKSAAAKALAEADHHPRHDVSAAPKMRCSWPKTPEAKPAGNRRRQKGTLPAAPGQNGARAACRRRCASGKVKSAKLSSSWARRPAKRRNQDPRRQQGGVHRRGNWRGGDVAAAATTATVSPAFAGPTEAGAIEVHVPRPSPWPNWRTRWPSRRPR